MKGSADIVDRFASLLLRLQCDPRFYGERANLVAMAELKLSMEQLRFTVLEERVVVRGTHEVNLDWAARFGGATVPWWQLHMPILL
ncbi:hypothetical protein CYMTET_52808 [Cymbomonas tetramitiformis]|uniref:Uncharacterized protein n=1 Tax=Cymbomonas tetramitiformis TaxID=36881 RepID=A0AAE0EQZ9_9CHLO|nr:hypothetical protein CYMTET_52808 [Cymbomonas tetramitiformis]